MLEPLSFFVPSLEKIPIKNFPPIPAHSVTQSIVPRDNRLGAI
jgi:hypothetical protein